MRDTTPRNRDPLSLALAIVVALSLLTAALFLASSLRATPTEGVSGPPIGTPSPGDPTEPQPVITADDLRELALALAAVITALTGLLGLVAAQVWRGREETRSEQKHLVSLERQRLELERERLKLEEERLALERQRRALRGAE